MEIYAKEFFIYKHSCIDNLFTLLDGVVYLFFFFLNTVCKIQLKNVFQDCIDLNIKRIFFSYIKFTKYRPYQIRRSQKHLF